MRARAAIKAAVRDALRQELGLKDGECDVCPPPGRPHPRAGRRFLAVCDGPQTSQHTMSVDSYYTFQVVASMQAGPVPADRLGTGLLDREPGPADLQGGLNDLVESVAAAVFAKQWAIANDADAKMSPAVNGVLEAPRPIGLTSPEEVGYDWFGAEAVKGVRVAGYRAGVTFVCRVMQLQASGTF